jgi:hypothetical protein
MVVSQATYYIALSRAIEYSPQSLIIYENLVSIPSVFFDAHASQQFWKACLVIVGDVTKRSKLVGTPDYAIWSIRSENSFARKERVCSINVDPQETTSNVVVDSGASSAKTNKFVPTL